MSTRPLLRGNVYIDGFNLYHALDDLQNPYLKWLNLRRLSERFARGHAHEIQRVVFCTAFFPGDFEKRKRHEAYNKAQQAYGVDILLGHATKEPMRCNSCTRRWEQPREKETDINLALALYADAAKGNMDVAFLLSADTDQAATLKFMRKDFPQITLVVVTPPGRHKSTHLKDNADANIKLKEDDDDIDACILPALVTSDTGRAVVRPAQYLPPKGWVHPDDRP